MAQGNIIHQLDMSILQNYQLIEKYKNIHSPIPSVQKILYGKQLMLYQTIAELKVRKQLLLRFKYMIN